jgi:DNA-binding PadR family transcriptional regulator
VPRNLGEFEQLLLFAILRLGADAYGVRIRQEIEERTGRTISVGAVYTGLDRLQSRELVISWLGDSTPERGGRRRKFYRLEPEGAALLHGSFAGLKAMAVGVERRLSALAERAGTFLP